MKLYSNFTRKSKLALVIIVVFLIFLSNRALAIEMDHKSNSANLLNNVGRWVPFQLAKGGTIVVSASVNKKSIKDIIDTGMTITTIDSRTVKNLALEKHSLSAVTAEGGTVALARIGGASFEFSGIGSQIISPTESDLSQFDNVLGKHIDAVIGMDILSKEAI